MIDPAPVLVQEAKRADLATPALAPFVDLAETSGFPYFTGQGMENRLVFGENDIAWIEYGDLRVVAPGRVLIVEPESAGGLTNLVKFWKFIEDGTIDQPLTLFHLFRCDTEISYISHRLLWEHVLPKMQRELGDRFEALKFIYRDAVSDLRPAIEMFRARLIAAGAKLPPTSEGSNDPSSS